MRELKFRVWDNISYMSNPFTLNDLQLRKIMFVPDCPIMQFTGLLDKNGKEIYEGDVLRSWYSRDLSGKDIIRFNEVVEFQVTHEGSGFDISFLDKSEVVGNVFENPELLA
jgi:uncharacterized phage protein (TIGR01671 family)